MFACVLLAIVLLVPIPMRLKDGGTVVYRAVLYQVEDVHRLGAVDTAGDEYLEGMIVEFLGWKFTTVLNKRLLWRTE